MAFHHLEENNINIVVKELGVPSRNPDGTQNPIWKMIVSVMASVYELERWTISERIRQGREAYQQQGGRAGPSDPSKAEKPFSKNTKNHFIITKKEVLSRY